MNIKYKNNLTNLKKDLLKIKNVVKIDYDLSLLNEGIKGIIIIIDYKIPNNLQGLQYFKELEHTKKKIFDIIKKYGTDIEFEEFEDNDTYFYIVSYNNNWEV